MTIRFERQKGSRSSCYESDLLAIEGSAICSKSQLLQQR
jgi:hypothetical protein